MHLEMMSRSEGGQEAAGHWASTRAIKEGVRLLKTFFETINFLMFETFNQYLLYDRWETPHYNLHFLATN